jgi:predicted HicB family RNase H-like nuclease
LRIPASLHTRLLSLAKQEETSFNQLILSPHAEEIGRIDQRLGR